MPKIDIDSAPARDGTAYPPPYDATCRARRRKRLGNAFDAADLTQDTYVRLLGRSGAEIQAIREPRALLMTIAQGLAANLYRKRCVEQAYLDALALMPEAVAQSPEHRAIVQQTLVEVDRLLALLPLPVRQAFLLSQSSNRQT